MVGVSNDRQVLHCTGYSKLVGSSLNSWGWHVDSATAFHDGKGKSAHLAFPPLKEFSGIDYPKPGAVALESFDTMIMVLDMEAGTLAYMVNNIYLGTAFSGLQGPLYPMISCTWGDAEVALIFRWVPTTYIQNGGIPFIPRGSLVAKPLSLQELTRDVITWTLDGGSPYDLGLPTRIGRFLLYEN